MSAPRHPGRRARVPVALGARDESREGWRAGPSQVCVVTRALWARAPACRNAGARRGPLAGGTFDGGGRFPARRRPTDLRLGPGETRESSRSQGGTFPRARLVAFARSLGAPPGTAPSPAGPTAASGDRHLGDLSRLRSVSSG
jgi:hypothetical protein